MANLKPQGKTDVAASLNQVAAMLRHASLVMIFSDLLADPEPVVDALRRLRHDGHDVILFHVLDEAEVRFPFDGMMEFEDPENNQRLQIDATGFRRDYLAEVEGFCDTFRRECFQSRIDYVGLDTSMQFDKALTEYLVSRKAREIAPFIMAETYPILKPLTLPPSRITVGLLPPTLREQYGYTFSRWEQRVLDSFCAWTRRSAPFLPAQVRYVWPYLRARRLLSDMTG